MTLTIAACLIVRNEERFLEACLASLKDHVDEIVLVDTGSIDRSKEIARSFGVHLLEIKWADDFAAARNTGLASARSDWILYIDADERLSLPDGRRLTEQLGGNKVFAARVRFIASLNTTPYREYRLFRNDPRLRFHGAMHETILPDLEKLLRANEAIVAESPATITHYGYEGDLTHKFRRNVPWLRASVDREPKRLYYSYDLARCLSGLGEREEAMQLAHNVLAQATSSSAPLDHTVGSAAADILASLLKLEGKESMPVIEAGLALKPGQPRLSYLKAELLAERGELEAAREVLEVLCAVDPETFMDPTIGYSRHLFTHLAPHLLGTILLRLGQVSQAAGVFARVAASLPDDGDFARNAVLLGKRDRG